VKKRINGVLFCLPSKPVRRTQTADEMGEFLVLCGAPHLNDTVTR
jgi:hypothetical protein